MCLFFALAAFGLTDGYARCRVQDLLQCLDSVCAPNIGTSPGARCYTCGTAAAPRPATPDHGMGEAMGMQALALGTSSRNAVPERELRSAPTDPGERYQWATRQCIQRVSTCSAYDVEEHYDPLIQQSCRIAMGDAEFLAQMERARERRTEEECTSEFNLCLLDSGRCGGDMLACETGEDFNRNFSACMVEVTGCDDFSTTLRTAMLAARDRMIATRDSRLEDLVALRRMERENRREMADRMCLPGGMAGCVAEMCGNLPTGLDDGGYCTDQNERMWSTNLCRFLETACARLR